MKALAKFTNREGYLLVTVLGQWTEETAKGVIDDSKQEAVNQGYNHILFDLTKWKQPDTEMTRFWAGEYLAKQFPSPFKTAAFAIPEAINKFAENTAVNRGAWFRVFSKENEAVDWLLEAQQRSVG